jgi:hypothetical protein
MVFSRGVYPDILCNVYGFGFMFTLIYLFNDLAVILINKVILFKIISWVLA